MDLSVLLAFNQLVIGKTEEEKKKLAEALSIDYEEYEKRIVGKEKEAEFIIILKSLDALKHLEAYDEGFSHITGEYTSDFKIELRDGYKMLLEVKHTDKDEFRISQGNLQNRIDFANRQNLQLRFAVSLKGVWGLFTSETMLERNGRLTFDDFLGPKSSSWLDIELATCSYMFQKPVKTISVYSTAHPGKTGVQFEPYGELISYKFFYGDRQIFEMEGADSRFLLHTLCLEALQDRVSNCHQDVRKDGELTIITEYTELPQMIPEYAFLLAPIHHMSKEIDSKRVKYTSQLAVFEKNFRYLSVQVLRHLLYELVDLGLDIIVFRGCYGYGFKDYAANFWNAATSS